jgi:hypothetical protein
VRLDFELVELLSLLLLFCLCFFIHNLRDLLVIKKKKKANKTTAREQRKKRENFWKEKEVEIKKKKAN